MSSRSVVIVQPLRLRAQPAIEAFAPVIVPRGASVELLSLDPPGWMELRTEADGRPRTGWCRRRMLDAALRTPISAFPSGDARMWDLVRQYTGRVGYRRGAEASPLGAEPPTIDCPGWVSLLLTEAMEAQNAAAGEDIFDAADIAACRAWSDRIVLEIEARTPVLLEGPEITAADLPRNATISLNEGYFAWQENHPGLRGINHIVQVVRRPADAAPFVSESHSTRPGGVRLTRLSEWLDAHARHIRAGMAWAVDPFAMAAPTGSGVLGASAGHERPESTRRQLTRASTPLLPPTVGSRTMS